MFSRYFKTDSVSVKDLFSVYLKNIIQIELLNLFNKSFFFINKLKLMIFIY